MSNASIAVCHTIRNFAFHFITMFTTNRKIQGQNYVAECVTKDLVSLKYLKTIKCSIDVTSQSKVVKF